MREVLPAKAKEGGSPFFVEPSSLVWSSAHQSTFTLKKLVADVYPSTTCVIGHEQFEMGKFPKELKASTSPRILVLKDPQCKLVWQAAHEGKNVKAVFIMRYEDSHKGRLVPAGVALVNVTQWTVPKGADPVECA